VLTSDAALHALRPEWEALWRRAAAETTPFQSPAWLLPWWRAFGTGRPRAAALRGDGGKLLGLLPLYLLEEGSETKLLPVGIGVSDYLDALLDPDAPPDGRTLVRPPAAFNVDDGQLRAGWLAFARPLATVAPLHGAPLVQRPDAVATARADLTRHEPTSGFGVGDRAGTLPRVRTREDVG